MKATAPRILAFLSLSLAPACANIWGFSDLTGGDSAPDASPASTEGGMTGADGSQGDALASPEDATTEPPVSVDGPAPAPDATLDATIESGADASPDIDVMTPMDGPTVETGPRDASDGGNATDAAPDGCGPTNTVTNCGACGQACDTTHSRGATCDGTSCSYAGCAMGWADCKTTAPDTDGCETAISGPATCGACGQSCDTTHSMGAMCSGSTCTYSGCASGWADCNASPPDTNGCETSLALPSDCGKCGQACDTRTGTPSCNGSTCSYSCNSGRADCNASSGADTDGCECATPSCCGSMCQMAHDNGVGDAFYDCTSLGTHTQSQALEACKAFTASSAQCTMSAITCGLLGLAGSVDSVCGSSAGKCYCWAYGGTYMSGSFAGTVQTASVSSCSAACPASGDAVWN